MLEVTLSEQFVGRNKPVSVSGKQVSAGNAWFIPAYRVDCHSY